MIRTSLRPYTVMGSLIAVMVAVVAAGGMLNPDMYRPVLVSDALVAGLPVQDFLSLIAAVLLVVAMVSTGRGSVRAFVVWAGLLVFIAYYYAFYCFGYIYTIYYPLYLAILGMSVYSLAGLLVGVDVNVYMQYIREKMPVRFISFVLAMPLLLVPIWSMGILRGIRTQQAVPADLVFVLDLCFMIPAMTFAAVQIWRRRPVGYLLGGVLLVKAALSGILLTGGSLRQVLLGYTVGPDVGMYIFLLVAGIAGFVLFMRNLQEPV
jgi:hypothetical protein